MRGVAALAMGVAIAGMHFTGMSAAQFSYEAADRHPPADGMAAVLLAIAVAGCGDSNTPSSAPPCTPRSCS